MKQCQLCNAIKTDIRQAKVLSCTTCLDKLLEFAITAGIRFEKEVEA